MFSEICGYALLLVMTAAYAAGADWPAFRGPNGNGISDETAAPTNWSPTDNIQWKVPLPRPGNGSPIVVDGKVFVTSAEDDQGLRRSLYCFSSSEGKKIWKQTVNFGTVMPTHRDNPYCATTPVSDGQRVVVWHGSAGLYCYDLEGKELWNRDLGEFRHMWGYATSPIIHQDDVILYTGPGERVFVTSINLKTGTTNWETGEPVEGDGERRKDDKAPVGSWCTPRVASVNGKDQVIVLMPTRVNAYDPETGDIVWWCEGLRQERGDLAYSSPVIAGDICFVTGGYNGPAMAILMGGQDDVTETHRLWRTENSPQNVGSGVFLKGVVYRPNDGPGTIECIHPETGDILWKDRAAGGEYWGSIVVAGGLLHATNQDGLTVVFKSNAEQYHQVAENELGEPSNATPAIANGHIYIRTTHHLFCIGS